MSSCNIFASISLFFLTRFSVWHNLIQVQHFKARVPISMIHISIHIFLRIYKSFLDKEKLGNTIFIIQHFSEIPLLPIFGRRVFGNITLRSNMYFFLLQTHLRLMLLDYVCLTAVHLKSWYLYVAKWSEYSYIIDV